MSRLKHSRPTPLVQQTLAVTLGLAIGLTLGACSGTAPLEAAGDQPVSGIEAVSGDDQQGLVGETLTDPVVVRLVASDGFPVAGRQVTFQVLSGGGSVTSATELSSVEGTAQTWWTLGDSPGEQTIEARALETPDGEQSVVTVFRVSAVAQPTDAPDTVPPGRPGALQAALSAVSSDSFAVSLSWSPGTDATGYHWTAGVESGNSWSTGGTVNATTASFHAPRVGATFWACVESVDAAANVSPESSCNRYAPPASSGLTVTVSPSSASVAEGDTVWLSAIAEETGGVVVARTFSWSSSDTSVARVDSLGRVNTADIGTAVITAATDGQSGSATIHVLPTLTTSVGDTIFYDGFEGGSLSGWSEVSSTLARVVSGPGVASDGNSALELTVPSGHVGTWLTRFFGPGRDSVFVRFKVRFPSDWTGNTKLLFVRGSLASDLWSAWGTAGQCPDGSQWFQTGNATYETGNPGRLNFYTYFPDMSRESDGITCWGRFGDGSTRYETMPPMAKEAWHTVEFWVRLNEPTSRDALQRMWVDGQLRADWAGFRLRTTSDVRINSITLHAYPDAPSSQSRRLLYDEVLVTTASPY